MSSQLSSQRHYSLLVHLGLLLLRSWEEGSIENQVPSNSCTLGATPHLFSTDYIIPGFVFLSDPVILPHSFRNNILRVCSNNGPLDTNKGYMSSLF